jgi:cell division protease FtsH
MPEGDPVRKVTIIPRGLSGGSTLFVPDEDISYVSKSRMKDQIVIALGGRAAEEIVFDEVTTGASSDLERVTKIARAMVTRFGMSDKLGPMMFGQKEEMIFLGREISEQRDYSEAVAEEIDDEVRGLVNGAYDRARALLREHRDRLDLVANRLLDVETLEQDEFLVLMGVTPAKAAPGLASNAPESPAPYKAKPKADEGGAALGHAPSPA